LTGLSDQEERSCDFNRRLRNIILILLLLAAFALRLYRLDHQEIWGDEAHSAYVVKLPLLSTVSPRTETNPPLYHLLLYLWVRLTGSSVFALRFLSLILGVLTVPLVYQLARLAFGELVGLLAALLGALSPFLVYYSQEARMYALATFATTLSMFLLARIVSGERGASRPRRFSGNLRGLKSLWFAYFLATTAALFTHYYALFVVVAQNVVMIALWRRNGEKLRCWLAVQAVLALSFLPWVLAQRGFLGGKASARFDELTLPVLISIVKRSLVAFSVGTTVKAPLAYYFTLAFLLLAALAFMVRSSDGLMVEWSDDLLVLGPPDQRPLGHLTKDHPTTQLLAWLVIPLILAWLVNPLMPFFQERYLLVIAPAFIILVARGLERCPELVEGWLRDRSPWALVLALLFLISASSLSLHNWFFDHAYTKGEYGLMMDYVRDRAQQGDLLLLNNPLQEALFDYYRPPGVSDHLLSRHDLRTEQQADQALVALTEGYSRVWLVMFGYAEQYDPDHLAERWLSEHGYRSSYRSFLGAYLTLYVMSPSGVGSSMQHTVAASLGNEALLVGYSLSAGEIKAGETLMLTLYWQALAEMEKRYTVFVHLLDADNRIVAQMDSEPLGGTHPTTEWQFGEIVRDNYGLLIAPHTPPGEYLLEVGMYYLPTLERLPVLDASGNVKDDRVVLGTIQQARE
jgi:mannosyltransferase